MRVDPEDLYERLHSLSKVLESSGVIDESEYRDAYPTILDSMNFVRAALPDDAVRQDAERYRWLRDCHPADDSGLWVAMGVPHSPAGISCWRHEELDTAIDAAMKDESAP